MAKLYETYPALVALDNSENPWPVSHIVKNAHVEMVLDNKGVLKPDRCKILTGYDAATLIPATEASAGRAGAVISPHPLNEELGYCALDLPGGKQEKIEAYMAQLQNWQRSDSNQAKLKLIFDYLQKGTLYRDIDEIIGFPIRFEKKDGTKEKLKNEKVFIRWKVEKEGDPQSSTWKDQELIDSWVRYDKEIHESSGLCFITAENTRLAKNNPRFIRRPGDGAKILSSNDHSGFTFRGRFTDSKKSIESLGIQGTGVSYEVSQKAHSALRRLIVRQGQKYGESKDDPGSVVVAWAVSGKDIPQPMEDVWDSMPDEIQEISTPQQLLENKIDHSNNLGQQFSIALGKYMAGYRVKLQPTDNIIIMGLDSATPGRMAVTYYQEFFPDDYIERISKWHTEFSWYQRHKIEEDIGKKKIVSKTVWPVCTPSPRAIWEAIYGNTISDSLKKNTVERILPCIVEARPFPLDLVLKAVQRVSNRNSYKSDEQWLWEKHLGIACALYRGFCKRHPKQTKEYIVGLEQDNNSRDYLYGRLLAIAEKIEEMAMIVSKEKVRTTHASRLMKRFSDHPASTWLHIEEGIIPYQQRLRSKIPPLEDAYKRLLDDVFHMFEGSEFVSPNKLSGEYLLGYHCQRKWLRDYKLKEGKWVIRDFDETNESQDEGDE